MLSVQTCTNKNSCEKKTITDKTKCHSVYTVLFALPSWFCLSPQWNDREMGLQMKLYLDVFSKRCSGQLMRACSQKIKATLLAGYRLSFLSNHMCNFLILCKYNWGTLYSGYCVALIQSILFELLKNPVFVMYCRQKSKTSVSYGMCYFQRCWIVFFFWPI